MNKTAWHWQPFKLDLVETSLHQTCVQYEGRLEDVAEELKSKFLAGEFGPERPGHEDDLANDDSPLVTMIYAAMDLLRVPGEETELLVILGHLAPRHREEFESDCLGYEEEAGQSLGTCAQIAVQYDMLHIARKNGWLQWDVGEEA